MEKKLFNNQKLLIKVVFYFNMFISKIKSGPLKIKFKNYLLVLFIPVTIFSQIEKQVRDQNPGLFKNQKLYHSIPNPFFKSRSHNLDFITDIPTSSVGGALRLCFSLATVTAGVVATGIGLACITWGASLPLLLRRILRPSSSNSNSEISERFIRSMICFMSLISKVGPFLRFMLIY